MEDKTYSIKLPKTIKKKYKYPPYKSHSLFLRFIEFFDFNLPYRSWGQRWFILAVMLFVEYFLVRGIFPYMKMKESWGVLSFFFGLTFVIFLIMCIPRNIQSNSLIFSGNTATEYNGARTFRYCVAWFFTCAVLAAPLGVLSVGGGSSNISKLFEDLATGIAAVFLIGLPALLFFVAYDDAISK